MGRFHFWPGKGLSPRGYFVRLSPFAGNSRTPPPRRTGLLRHRTATPPQIPAASPPIKSSTSSTPRGWQFHFDEPVWQWRRHAGAVSPVFTVFRIRNALQTGGFPSAPAFLRPFITASAAARIMIFRGSAEPGCGIAWMRVPIPPAPRLAHPKQWGLDGLAEGCQGNPLIKALSSPLRPIRLLNYLFQWDGAGDCRRAGSRATSEPVHSS